MTDQTAPIPLDCVHPEKPGETGFFHPDSGKPIPPTHTDHEPMGRLPHDEDSGFAYHFHSAKDELNRVGIAGIMQSVSTSCPKVTPCSGAFGSLRVKKRRFPYHIPPGIDAVPDFPRIQPWSDPR